MKIFPNTTLKILRGCPCDPDYEHTLYFSSKASQATYFETLTKYTVNQMTYQRAKSGRIRVQYTADDLYDCNYLMFQNTAFGDKWFYAFIDSVTYVGNITAEISYSIDVIQTWLLDFTLQQCYVEREHSVTDNIGDNIVGENLPFGEYTGTGLEVLNKNGVAVFSDWVIVVSTAVDESGLTNSGGFYGRLYSQVEFKAYPPTPDGISSLFAYFNTIGLIDRANIVVSVYMCPKAFIAPKQNAPDDQYYHDDFSLPGVKILKRKDGSNVKNKKLMTYPYTFLEVTNLQGTVNRYPFEFFNNAPEEEKIFHGFCDTSASPTFVLMPTGYKGNINPNADERITLGDFPLCPWAVGDLLNKIATTAISAATLGLTSSLMKSSPPVGQAKTAQQYLKTDTQTGATSFVTNRSDNSWSMPVQRNMATPEVPEKPVNLVNTQSIVAQMMMNNLLGGGASHVSGGGSSMFNAGWFSICYQQKQIMPEYVDIIDDYFNRYGYATRKVKTPNISSRPYWNYVQTVGCKINGSIPCQDEQLICSIFDHGITFWKNGANVGNYSLDNSPS